MGSVISNYRSVYLHEPQLLKYRVEFEILKLDQHVINKLYKAFQNIKHDPNQPDISCAELLTYLEVERNHFTDLIFRALDKDDNKKLDFREFVVSLWNYCTLGEEALVHFAFDIYDVNDNGTIERCELEGLLRDAYGKFWPQSKPAMKVLSTFENLRGSPDAEWFKELSKQLPSLFFPIFHMQMRLQEKICGRQFWAKLANKRVCDSGGNVVYVKDVIGFHSNKRATRDIVAPKIRRSSAPSSLPSLRRTAREEEFADLVEAANVKHLVERENSDSTLVVTTGDCFDMTYEGRVPRQLPDYLTTARARSRGGSRQALYAVEEGINKGLDAFTDVSDKTEPMSAASSQRSPLATPHAPPLARSPQKSLTWNEKRDMDKNNLAPRYLPKPASQAYSAAELDLEMPYSGSAFHPLSSRPRTASKDSAPDLGTAGQNERNQKKKLRRKTIQTTTSSVAGGGLAPVRIHPSPPDTNSVHAPSAALTEYAVDFSTDEHRVVTHNSQRNRSRRRSI